jgi:predicted 3-demethylubiquinone-9 3-methyltransferase (glyoxalase superfamily)
LTEDLGCFSIKVGRRIDQVMQENDKEQIARVTEAFLQMKKLDIAKLKTTYESG